ncbi:MAG: hypothetical protein LBJ08_10450 [Bifidobacteriaceae bacterium]|nr:hypothetical protein [Bifidobacteriaceae bacterium]
MGGGPSGEVLKAAKQAAKEVPCTDLEWLSDSEEGVSMYSCSAEPCSTVIEIALDADLLGPRESELVDLSRDYTKGGQSLAYCAY